MQVQEYIGVDVGEVRSGIARASSVARIAEPLRVVKTEQLLSELTNLINAESVQAVVIGLPRNLDGDDTGQTRWVRDWANHAKDQLSTNLYFQDEALTTVSADTRKGQKPSTDADAAAIILQDFLDTNEDGRIKV